MKSLKTIHSNKNHTRRSLFWFAALALSLTAHRASAQTLVSGYNFGSSTTGTVSFPYNANHGNGSLSSNFSGAVSIFTGTTVNAATGDTAGGAIAPAGNNNNGDAFTFSLNLTGYNAPVLTYAAQRTGSGFTDEDFYYSTDGGATFSSLFKDVNGLPSAFAVQTVDFSAVTALANDANAEIKIVFQGATTATGNNRIDNVQFNSTTFSGGGGTPTAYQYFDLNSTTPGSGIANNSTNTFSGTHFNASSDGTGATAAFTNDGTATATFSAGTDSAGKTYTVNIDTAVKTNGLAFTDANVTLAHATGGSLTLYGAAVNVATGSTATISETIASSSGTIGLTKTGLGTLILSGTNTYGGSTSINAGILSVSSSANLPAATNGIVLGGGTLQTTAALSLGNAFTGAGSLDIAPGTTLASTGSFNTTSTTLVNTGTLDLQGSTPAVGNLTFSAPGTLISSTGGTISATGLDATNLTGTATVSAPLSFGAAGTVNVGASGDLVLGGAITSTGTSAFKKTGTGTLELDGSNTGLYRVQIGTASATSPTVGGTVVINNPNAVGKSQLYLNVGTLNATTDLTSTTGTGTIGNALPVGVSLGGLSNGASVITGSNVEFTGASDFYENTTLANALTVNNTTILSGAVTSGNATNAPQSVTSPGVLLNGTGTLRLTGANNFADPVTLSGGVTLEAAGTGGNQALSGTLKITANAGGTLLLSTANQVNTAAPLVLNTGAISLANGAHQGSGATLSGGMVTGSSAVGLGALTLQGSSTLNYLGTAATAVFTSFDPTNAGAGTFTLNVTGSNFSTPASGADGTNNRLIFNEDIQAAGFLGEITFNGAADATEIPLDNGFYEIFPSVAAPEPGTVFGGAFLVGAAAWTLRRRVRRAA